MKTRKEKVALKLSVLALAMAVGIAALPGNSVAGSTKRMLQVQWQQARVERNGPAQERQAWTQWQAEQLRQARLYEAKVNRADTYRARVQRLERQARAQLAKIESWHKRAEKLAHQKAVKAKLHRTALTTAKIKGVLQVAVRAD